MKELYPDIISSTGSWAKIEISDSGVGIPAENIKRIFEPFFTTKKQDQGSGLGLAISYNIIRQHKGVIHVYSEPGRGTVFSVYLPLYRNLKKIDPPSHNNCKITKGSGSILIIDDEPAMLSIGKGILEECGYTLFTASGGIEGIEIYKNNFPGISAVLMDLSMPGMSGLEVFLELKKINKDVKVLLASGMLTAESLEAAEKAGIQGTVNKPYLAHELSSRIEKILTD
jgi:CheY-like chemotaxis protein